MTNRLLLFMILSLLPGMTLFGQGFQKVYDHEVERSLIRLVDQEEASHYLAKDGQFLVINTPEVYRVISGQDGSEILSGRHMEKSAGNQLLSNVFQKNTLGMMADGEALKESSGFYVFEDQQVVVFLDWTLDQNVIRGFHTQSGISLLNTTAW